MHRNELLKPRSACTYSGSIHQHPHRIRATAGLCYVMFSQTETDCPLRTPLLWNEVKEHPCQENIGLWFSPPWNKTQLSCLSGPAALRIKAPHLFLLLFVSFSQRRMSKHVRFWPLFPLKRAFTAWVECCHNLHSQLPLHHSTRSHHQHLSTTLDQRLNRLLFSMLPLKASFKLREAVCSTGCTQRHIHTGERTFPHPELRENLYSLHIHKHNCTKHTQTWRHCKLSLLPPRCSAA